MTRVSIGKVLAALAVLALTTTATSASENVSVLHARLTGFQQVPPIFTHGSGTFTARMRGGSITFTLTYSDLSTPASMAHLHFGQRAVNGGIFVWLCGTAGGKPACPPGNTAATATVKGTLTANDIVAVSSQGLQAKDFAAALQAIESGEAYVNVHTTDFPGGEIRGQVNPEGENRG